MSDLDFKSKRKALGFTQEQVAKALGVDRRTIIKYEQGFTIPDSKAKLMDFLYNENVNKSDIVEALSVNDAKEQIANSNGNVYEDIGDGKFKIFVKKVPVKAFGSYLSHYQDPEYVEELKQVSFTVDHIGKGNYICFEVQGESMNGGGIYDAPEGAELLCRELGRQHWKDGFRESIYGWVIVHKETVLYKDITDFDPATGDITCHSRSGKSYHPDFKINLDDVSQIWKVIKRSY
jgi:transcriptional regulator with XRE-family HTH domain